MNPKYIITILKTIFFLAITTKIISQDMDLDKIDPHIEFNFENNFEKFSEKFESPPAVYKEAAISDYRVNEQIGNSSKSFVKSAINSNGVSIIVWEDLREGADNVYAQLADSNGNLIGSNIKVNTSEIQQTFEQPDVSVNEDGQFLVIWRSTDTGVGIDGQLIGEDGSFINENFEINDESLNAARYYPSINSNGKEFVVVWADGRNGSLYDIYAQRLNKDGSKIDENFIVNADTQGVNKVYPDVSLNADGNFAATWYANVDGGNKIFSNVISSSNQPFSEQKMISDITNSSSNNFGPTIAESKNGFMIGWSRYMDGDYNIICQLIDSTGEKIESNFIINDDLKSTQLYPSAASDNEGNLIITWYDSRNNFAQIYSQKIINDELSGVNYQTSEDELKGYKNNVACAINSKGKLVVSWLNYTDQTEYQVFSRIIDSSKTPITESFRVDDDENSSEQNKPEISVFDDGSYVIVWVDTRNRTSNIFFQLFNPAGTLIGENQIVGSTNYKIFPKIIPLANNNFTIIWREYNRGTFSQYELVGQKYSPSGELIGDNFLISSDGLKGAIGQLDAASNSNDEIVVTWERRVNNINRIYANKTDADGNTVGEIFQVSGDTSTYHYAPKIGIDSAGNFAVTYYSRINNDNEILLHRYNNLAEPIDSTIIVNDDESNFSQYAPDISVNSNGDAVVTWFDYRAPSGIYFQKYSNIGSETLFEKVDLNIAVVDYYVGYTFPKISLNNSGEFAITWSERSNSQDDSKFRLFNFDQTPFTEVLYVSETNERNQKEPSIYLSEDKIYIAWQDNSEKSVGYDIWAKLFNIEDFLTDIDESAEELPTEFSLKQNYPNPFNPTTVIEYTVPSIVNENFRSLQLRVYDILGREVKVLVNKYQQPGNYKIEFDGSGLTSGMYFYKIDVGNYSEIKKMLLLK